MNTPSHILMGRYLCRYVEKHYGIRLNRRSYLFGNVIPDYYPTFLIRPHHLKNNVSHVQHIIRLLLTKYTLEYEGRRFSYYLGMLCHFYADFFCFAHSDAFRGGLPEHIAYEKRLNNYFSENIGRIASLDFAGQPAPASDADGVYRQFETLHSGYLRSRRSFGNDLIYTMMACIDLIVETSGAPAAKRHPDPDLMLSAV